MLRRIEVRNDETDYSRCQKRCKKLEHELKTMASRFNNRHAGLLKSEEQLKEAEAYISKLRRIWEDKFRISFPERDQIDEDLND
jgi:hypothetical protein